jgi:hypothetical protein
MLAVPQPVLVEQQVLVEEGQMHLEVEQEPEPALVTVSVCLVPEAVALEMA